MVECAGAVVRDAAGRLLLVRRGNEPNRGTWSLPGGRVEAGETHREAAAREVREETGLEVEVGERLATVRLGDYDVQDFAAQVVGGSLLAGDDAMDAAWFAPEDLDGLATSPGLVEELRRMRVL